MPDVMIEARDLSKRYGPFQALKDVSFEVHRGEVLGFLGPNGAGKSTTMKILTCFIAPTEGTAKVNGADIFEDPMSVRRAIGYLPESTPLYTDMLVFEYLEFVAKMRGYQGTDVRKRIKQAIEQTSLEDVVTKEIRALSKGYRQRVGLAQALVHEPEILILDEPLSGLDPNQAAEIRELIVGIGKERTVVLSTHNLAEVQQTCDRVLIVSKGRLVADDTPEELRERTGKASYLVTLKKGESEKKLREVFGAIKGVQTVRPKETDAEGEVAVLVRPKSGQDLRAEIFQAAVQNELTLLGLEKQAAGLDQVFRELTSGDADALAEGVEAKHTKGEAKKADKPAAPTTSDDESDEDEK